MSRRRIAAIVIAAALVAIWAGDTAADVEKLPDGYTGGIWTNRIDKIAPLLQR